MGVTRNLRIASGGRDGRLRKGVRRERLPPTIRAVIETQSRAPAPRVAVPAEPAPTRTLVPHEHGAYGQLIMPLVTALAVARPTPAALALGAALVVAFVAHESLLVVLGQRGKRALEGDGPRARRVLAILGSVTIVVGAAGLVLAPPPARVALALPIVLAAAVAWLVLRRREKTIAGETVVAAALASGGLVVALAGGASVRIAVACWIAWVLAFAAATLAVQVILVRARSKGRRDPGLSHAAATVVLVAGAFAAAAGAALPWTAAVAVLPTAALSLVVCLARISPKRLRELGWAMIGSGVATMVILVAGLR